MLPQPKPEPRKRTKARGARHAAKVVKSVRQQCVERDDVYEGEMSRYSRAPWRYEGDLPSRPTQFRVMDANGDNVCVQYYGHEDRGITEANARLIAAAPDMFEALELIASRAGGCQLESHDPQSDEPIPEFVAVNEIREWARAAIAKAEGAR